MTGKRASGRMNRILDQKLVC